MEESHAGLLERDNAIKNSGIFKEKIDLINQLVDYGTNLLIRAFISSPRDITAICLILVQFRQFLVHLDGVSVLLNSGNCGSVTLQLRTLLELSITIQWMFDSDTIVKAKHLYVANMRQRRRWSSIAISGSPEAVKHADAASKLTLSQEQIEGLTDEVAQIDKILSTPKLSSINSKYDTNFLKRGFDNNWYEVYGANTSTKRSIKRIAEEIGRLKEYNYIYSSFSNVTHGSDMWRSIFFGKENMTIFPIREPQHLPKDAQLAATLALGVFKMIIKCYRAAEEETFNQHYLEQWRALHFKDYKIEINPVPIVI